MNAHFVDVRGSWRFWVRRERPSCRRAGETFLSGLLVVAWGGGSFLGVYGGVLRLLGRGRIHFRRLRSLLL